MNKLEGTQFFLGITLKQTSVLLKMRESSRGETMGSYKILCSPHIFGRMRRLRSGERKEEWTNSRSLPWTLQNPYLSHSEVIGVEFQITWPLKRDSDHSQLPIILLHLNPTQMFCFKWLPFLFYMWWNQDPEYWLTPKFHRAFVITAQRFKCRHQASASDSSYSLSAIPCFQSWLLSH